MMAARTIACDELQALALDLAASEKRRLEADAERMYAAAGALWNSAVTLVLRQHGEEKAPPGVVARKGADGKVLLEIPGAPAPAAPEPTVGPGA